QIALRDIQKVSSSRKLYFFRNLIINARLVIERFFSSYSKVMTVRYQWFFCV
ncbi:hypothetical protein COCCADRAFT_107428, partial [Bipolaris zeicola 26-R-13]